jgi:hypothetical protein
MRVAPASFIRMAMGKTRDSRMGMHHDSNEENKSR